MTQDDGLTATTTELESDTSQQVYELSHSPNNALLEYGYQEDERVHYVVAPQDASSTARQDSPLITNDPNTTFMPPPLLWQYNDSVSPLFSQGATFGANYAVEAPLRGASLRSRVDATDPSTGPPRSGIQTPWRPSYLKRRIFATFLMVFIALIIAIEVLLAYSNKNQGIATGYAKSHYLWTYGPTAIFTVIAALWSRVEFQSKMMSPWIRMSKGPTSAEHSILLDYLDMMQPVALVRACKNHDWLVVSAATTTILLLLVNIFSTGLIILTPTQVTVSTEIQLQSRFIDDPSRLSVSSTVPYLTLYGLINHIWQGSVRPERGSREMPTERKGQG